MIHSFSDKLRLGRTDRDDAAIRALLPQVETIVEQPPGGVMDRLGIDYVAFDGIGRMVCIDVKTREAGARAYWHNAQREPEIALERWSDFERTPGWTWDAAKRTHQVLFLWDPADTTLTYLFNAGALRRVFHENFEDWRRIYKFAAQPNEGWTSWAMFVPVGVVRAAVDPIRRVRMADVPRTDRGLRVVR